jgi:MarR family transcriptional regulator, 2-MHQ and catechol-resistance regulon repressor
MEEKSKSYSPGNQLNLRLVIGLYRSYSRINRSSQKLMASYQLTVPQFGVLEALYHLGPMKIGDIIARMLSTSGNMTVVVKNLEQDGWICRYSDPSDGRVCLLDLTDKGENLIETIFPEHLKDIRTMLENLDETEKRQLIQLLKKLNGI